MCLLEEKREKRLVKHTRPDLGRTRSAEKTEQEQDGDNHNGRRDTQGQESCLLRSQGRQKLGVFEQMAGCQLLGYLALAFLRTFLVKKVPIHGILLSNYWK